MRVNDADLCTVSGHVQKTVHAIIEVDDLHVSQQKLVVFEVSVIFIVLILDKVKQSPPGADLTSIVEVDLIEVVATVQTWLQVVYYSLSVRVSGIAHLAAALQRAEARCPKG